MSEFIGQTDFSLRADSHPEVEVSTPVSSRAMDSESAIVALKFGSSIRKQQDVVVKEWLKRLIDDLDLVSLESFPTQELARDIPGLISFIADRLQKKDIAAHDTRTIAEMISSISDIRKENPSLSQLIHDYAQLKQLLLAVATANLRRSDRAIVDSMKLIDDVFNEILASGLKSFAGKVGPDTEHDSLSDIDPLTNLFSVRFFRRQLHRQLEMYKRYRAPFSLVMLDLDGLQQLNESLGDAAGDEALKNLAVIMLEEKRETDIAVRYGGDEFFLLLPGTVTVDAERLAYRLSRRVKELNLRSGGSQMTGVSVGVVACPENGTDVGTLRSRADKAMYMAKLLGGNRVARYRDFQQS